MVYTGKRKQRSISSIGFCIETYGKFADCLHLVYFVRERRTICLYSMPSCIPSILTYTGVCNKSNSLESTLTMIGVEQLGKLQMEIGRERALETS